MNFKEWFFLRFQFFVDHEGELVIHEESDHFTFKEMVEAWNAATEEANKKLDGIKIPSTEEEATAMAIVGTNWLKENAPHMLRDAATEAAKPKWKPIDKQAKDGFFYLFREKEDTGVVPFIAAYSAHFSSWNCHLLNNLSEEYYEYIEIPE
jgi:hypothetical protein